MKCLLAITACLALFVCGCACSPVRTDLALTADARTILQRNMTPEEVTALMGNPERPILIYFYNTNSRNSFLSLRSKDDYTPIVFVNNKLAGWGWNYLNGAAKDIMNN